MSSKPLDPSSNRRALLERMRRERGLSTSKVESRALVVRSGPVTAAQKRMWLASQMDGEGIAFNLAFRLRVEGVLDLERLQKALARVIARHEPLRTNVAFVDGELLQQVREPSDGFWRGTFELTGDPLFAAIDQEAAHVFALADESLFRATAFVVGPRSHEILFVFHHLVVDGWSLRVFAKELAEAYEAGEDAPTASPHPFTYLDFAEWERGWLETPPAKEHLAYWRDELRGAPSPPSIGAPRSLAAGTPRSHRLERSLGADLAARVTAFAKSEGATRYAVCLATFGAVLGRIAGETELTVGVTVTTREHPSVKGTIGLFLNTLPLRLPVGERHTFSEYLRRVKRKSLYGFTHQDVPIDLGALYEGEAHRPTALSNVLFIYQNETLEFRLGDARVDWSEVPRKTSKFVVTLEVHQRADDLVLLFEADAHRFDEADLDALADQYQTLLSNAIASPTTELPALSSVSDAVRTRLLDEWNRTAHPEEIVSLHRLFERAARATPTAVAVAFDAEEKSYAELDRDATDLANRLLDDGFVPGGLVGVLVEKSIEMVIAVLGVLKAGGGYVPIDPDYPADRIQLILEDAELSHCVVRSDAQDLGQHTRRVYARSSTPSARTEGLPEVAPSAVAYVIYTSGSTGRPKGVAISHRSAVARTLGAVRMYGIAPSDHVLQFASLSFDASVEEIFPTLAKGAALHLRTPDMISSVSDFLERAARWGLTVLDLPTAYWHVLVHEMRANALRFSPALRLVILGGEKALASAVAVWHDELGGSIRLVNTYGPTEATIVCLATDVGDLEGRELAIGRPTENTEAFVLDGELRLVAPGVAGELFIGGVGVALGYLNRAELTAQKFVANPFGAGRLYRTGDLARYRPNGLLDFEGRADHQVKLRGFRIELGEIEAELDREPAVRESAVVLQTDAGGMSRLVAFYVSDDAIDDGVLRQRLVQALPDYMVPSAIVRLPAMPLTPNRKVDRKALAATVVEAPAAAYEAPRGEIEALLAAIWGRLLGVENVGRNDNFFQLGGHSLLAAQMIQRLRAELAVQIPLGAVFRSPSLSGLARQIAASASAGDAKSPVEAPRPTSERPAPLSFGQERLWFLEELDPSSSAYNMPGSFVVHGPLDGAVLERAIGAVVDRHEVLRTTYRADAGSPAQFVELPGTFRLERVDLSARRQERDREVDARLRDYATTPFDLASGPVVRATLFHVADNEHVLVTCVHHIAYDGWSAGIFVSEMGAAYAALAAGTELPFAPLPYQYADYAIWQRRHLAGAGTDALLGYWKARLTGTAFVLELPLDRPRPPTQTTAGESVDLTFDAALTERLRASALAHGATLFTLLLAGFGLTLRRLSGQTDFVVGTPVANRGVPDAEGLIGFFVNTLPVRLRIPTRGTFAGLLAGLQSDLTEDFAHEALPFEKMVDALGVSRDTSRSPIFQAMFVLDSAKDRGVFPSDLTIEPRSGRTERVKVDLTLAMTESAAGLVASLEFATALFDRATMVRFGDLLRTTLERIADDAAAPLDAVLRLSPDASARLLELGTGESKPAAPLEDFLHRHFERQAALTPDRTALVFESTRLSYRELDARSNQLARSLRDTGVGNESVVAVMMERSLEMVISLYAILKAGGAYLPLDPELPDERLAFMANDAGVRTTLTRTGSEARAAAIGLHGLTVSADDGTTIDRGPPLDVALHPESAAYVIYTSGSTGTPKGVLNRHVAIANRIAWMQHAFPLAADDVVLQKTPFSFDVSVWEFFWPLMYGATLAIARPGGHRDPGYLRSEIERVGATTLHFVPSMLQAFVDDLDRTRCGSLRRVFASGEALSPATAELFLERSAAELHNLYGPTEAAVDVTFWSCVRGAATATLPIGRSIWNTTMRVVDENLELVPLGSVGELCISGIGLAREYVARPDLTAERFVPDPLSPSGARMYRTGDLGRILEDGALEYLGRTDHQVKIRGLRIELGEIDVALRKLDGVRDAAVLTEGEGAARNLVAYVVLDADRKPDAPDAALPAGLVDAVARLPEEVAFHLLELLR